MLSLLAPYSSVLFQALATGVVAHLLISSDVDREGRLRRPTRPLRPLATWSSAIWCSSATLSAVLASTDGGVGTRVAWGAAAIAAAAVSALTAASASWRLWALALWAGILGSLAPATVGALTHGPEADRSGALALLLSTAVPVAAGASAAVSLRFGSVGEVILRRHLVLTGSCLSVAVYALAGIATFRPPEPTGVGRAALLLAVLAMTAAVLSTVVAVLVHRRGLGNTAPGRAAILVQCASCVVVLCAVTALSSVPTPVSAEAQIRMIGFSVTGPWTWWELLTRPRPDLIFVPVAVVLSVAYLAGVRRLRSRGDSWPPGRTTSWLLGCAALCVLTGSGINRFAYSQFTPHMIIHIGLNLMVPALLALGGAVTLALRCLPGRPRRPTPGQDSAPGPRDWVLSLVHSPVARVLCRPSVALIVYVTTLFGLYFTPLFEWALRAPWGHQWMAAHFLITGYLFFWPIIGIDPGPSRLAHLGRLAVLFAIMPFHAFFGIAVMSMSALLARDFYSGLGELSPEQLAAQQHVGGAIAWISGELPMLVVFLALAVQWARSDLRAAARADRHSDRYDDDAEVYNLMLAELREQRR